MSLLGRKGNFLGRFFSSVEIHGGYFYEKSTHDFSSVAIYMHHKDFDKKKLCNPSYLIHNSKKEKAFHFVIFNNTLKKSHTYFRVM